MDGPRLPLALKLGYLAFAAVLVPVYITRYGLTNFLWFSNLALLGGLVAVWLESRRLASMFLVSVGLLELGWIGDFLLALTQGGDPPLGLAAYMFDPKLPLYLRALSLYHIPLPFLLLWVVWRLGYDQRAWQLWVPIGWSVLILSYFLAPPGNNINWTQDPKGIINLTLPDGIWLAILMAGSGLTWWVTHKVVEAALDRDNKAADV